MRSNTNVFGQPIVPCSTEPITGYFRDGCCNTDETDHGVHTICVILTDEFLEFSKAAGNDLSTPIPEWNFLGLKPGGKWCLCAQRWLDAYKENCAPQVYLEATNERTLDIIPLKILIEFAYKVPTKKEGNK